MQLVRISRVAVLISLLVLPFTNTFALSTGDYLQSAKQYMQAGELRKAVIDFKNALQKDSDNGEARLLLGQVYLRLGQAAAAEKELRHARRAGIARERVLPPLGQAYLGQGDANGVLEQLQPEAEDSAALRAEILTLRGRAYLISGEQDKAKTAFQQAAALSSGKADLALARAQLALVDKNPANALVQVEKALAAEPDNTKALAMKGELLRQKGMQKEALQAFEHALRSNPYNREALLGSATVHISLKELDAGERALKKLDDFAPGLVFSQYLKAVIAYQRKEFDKVHELMVPVMRAQPGNLRGELLVGMTDYLQGNLEAANEHLSNFIKAVPGNLQIRKLLATVRLKQRDADKAVEILLPATNLGAKDPQFLSMLGAAYLESGDTATAMHYLEQAADVAPNSAGAQARLGLGHLAAGDTDEAVSLLEGAVKKDPEMIQADLLLAQIHLRNGRFKEALEVAKALAEKRSKSALPHNLMAAAYLGLGDSAKAREELKQALKLDPSFAVAHINLARLDLKDGNQEGARAHYMAVLKQNDKHVGAMMGLAQLEAKAGKREETIAWLEKAHDKAPKALEPGVLLVRMYLVTGRPLKAVPVAHVLAEAYPKNPVALETLATVQLANGELADGIATYRALAEVKPELAPVQIRLGQLYLQQKEFDAARKAFSRALELQPDNLAALVSLGALNLETGEVGVAQELAAKILRGYPKSPLGYQLQGDIQRKAKDYRAAAQSYVAAYQQGSSAQLALLVYQMRNMAGDKAGALAALQTGTKDHPDAAALHLVLANEYMAAGRNPEAISEYERTRVLAPKNIVAWNNLAWLYHQQGDSKALEYARKARDLEPKKPEVLDTYGWIELMQGDPAKGLQAIQDAAVFGPHIPSVQYHLAVAQNRNGRPDAARKTLTRLLKSGKAFAEKGEAKKLLSQLDSASR